MEDVRAVAPGRIRRPLRVLRLASDERLVALLRDGDERAFEVIYDRHHRAILGFCRHMLGSQEEAEDAVQHTFLAGYRDLIADERRIQLRAWLFTIARNRCLSTLRARREHVALDAVEPSTEGLTDAVQRREDVRELLGDLARLPEDQRAALLLSELGALDHAGVAAVLGCRREQVKALVFQARSTLAADREARAIPCAEIRAELASARGAALRRGPLRRHLRDCAGCRAFGEEVARQRRLMAVALPVIPSIALKAGALGGIVGGHGAAASAGTAAGGSAAAGGGSTGAGALAGLASAGAAKVAVVAVAVATVAGGGALTVHAVRGSDRPAAHAPAPVGTSPTTAPAAAPGARRQPATAPGRSRHGAAGKPATAGGNGAQHGAGQTASPAGHAPGTRGNSAAAPGSAHARGRGAGTGRANAHRHQPATAPKSKHAHGRQHSPRPRPEGGSGANGKTKSPSSPAPVPDSTSPGTTAGATATPDAKRAHP